MGPKIRHLAIVSDDPSLLGDFYESAFHMKRPKPSGERRPGSSPKACHISDGNLGININPKKPGRVGGMDHFGIDVEDFEATQARLREKYPFIQILKRPSNRSFASFSSHDPAGNVFDLSQEGMENRRSMYAETKWEQKYHLLHITIRAINPAAIARFYTDVFEFPEEEKASDDPNFYLKAGQVTLIIAPWTLNSYEGTGIGRPGLDHIGFSVESVEALKRDLQSLSESKALFAPRPYGGDPEADARLKLLSTCRSGKVQLSDPDGVLIDACE